MNAGVFVTVQPNSRRIVGGSQEGRKAGKHVNALSLVF
jgi:hypothetical protein